MEARQVDAADLSRIAHLLIACRSGELGDHGTLWLLRRSLSSGLERQTHLWEDDAGSVVACAMLVGTHLEFYVHPDAQGSQVETQVMAWPGECVREQGMPILVSARASANDTARIALLEHYGFTRQAHRMLRFRRAFSDPLPGHGPPEGFTVRAVEGEYELTTERASP